jgi:hypothetical protein
VYYVRENSSHKKHEDPRAASDQQSKVFKVKKKGGGKAKEKSKEKKEDACRGDREKEAHKNKRFNTEPDSHNYLETLRLKSKRN